MTHADLLNRFTHLQVSEAIAFAPMSRLLSRVASSLSSSGFLSAISSSKRHDFVVNLRADSEAGYLQIISGLQIEPALSIAAKVPRQAQGGINGNPAPFSHNIVNPCSGNVQGHSQSVGAQADGLQVVLAQNFTRMNRAHSVGGIHAANSRNTSGCKSAILNKVCAALDGLRRPCSQACNVPTDTPSKAENAAWDSPVLARAATTGGKGTTKVSPASICRTDSSNSAAMSRPASNAVNSSSVSGFNGIFQFLQFMGGNGFSFAFSVQKQQHGLPFSKSIEVNHANAARFTRVLALPANFATAARTLYYVACFGVFRKVGGKRAALFFSPVVRPKPLKYSGFNNRLHNATIQQCCTHLQAAPVRLGTGSVLNSLDALGKAADNGGAVSLEAVSFDRLNTEAGQPRYSGFFTSLRFMRCGVPVHTIVAPSMVGRSGEAFGLAGFFCTSLSTLLRSRPLHLTVRGGDLTPTEGAYIMPKPARIFLTYSLVAIITLAIERNTPWHVILLALATLLLTQFIGGRNHAK